MRQPKQRISAQGLDLKDQVISINRVTKVVKGGKNMSFAALVVVGDEGGHVGFGTGKAREVPLAIKKAIEAAKKSLIRVPLIQNTVPHQLIGKFGAGPALSPSKLSVSAHCETNVRYTAAESLSFSSSGLPHSMMRSVSADNGDWPISSNSWPDAIRSVTRPRLRNGSRVTVG